VLHISIVILIALFAIQSRGTVKVAALHGTHGTAGLHALAVSSV